MDENLDEIRNDETNTANCFHLEGTPQKIDWDHKKLNVVYIDQEKRQRELANEKEQARLALGLKPTTDKRSQAIRLAPLEGFTPGKEYKVYAETYLTEWHGLNELFYRFLRSENLYIY